MAYNYTIPTHKKGDTFDGVQFQLTGVNLTGATIRMQLRTTAFSNVALELTETDGITVTNAATGIFQIDKQIIDIDPKIYMYEIEVTLSNGDVRTYIEGNWEITQDIAHD